MQRKFVDVFSICTSLYFCRHDFDFHKLDPKEPVRGHRFGVNKFNASLCVISANT